ncbi:MAG: diguanylate cyclase [Aquimonas sp.]|nr:diguanylate cyclase [Aquimonas sp.]
MAPWFPLLVWCCLWLPGVALASAPSAVAEGRPAIQRLTPGVEVFPQNFALAELHDGRLALGNHDGVLVFDGERWQLIRMPNREIVRSLAAAADGGLWVGGYNRFGRLVEDASGGFAFEDLTGRFLGDPETAAFADVWQVLPTPEGVYFRALRDLFFLPDDGGPGLHWRHDGRFGAIARLGDAVLLQFRGEGYRVREGAGWRPLPHSEPPTTLIHTLLPQATDALLGFGTDGGWWRIALDAVATQPMPEGLPPATAFHRGLRLRDGGLALSTAAGELWLLDAEHSRARRLRLEQGFLSGLLQARDGALLIAGDSQIHRVVWPPAFTALDADAGVRGDLKALRESAEGLLLVGSDGVLRVVPQADAPALIEPLPGAALDLEDRLALDDGRVLLAEGHRLSVQVDGQIQPLTDELIYPRRLQRSRFRPSTVWVLTEHGLRRLELGPALELSAVLTPKDNRRVLDLVEIDSSTLWLATQRGGVWRYRLDAAGAVIDAQGFGPEQGLALGVRADARLSLWPDGTLRASTHQGLFRYLGERFGEDDFAGLEALRLPEELLSLVPGRDGHAWAFSATRLLRMDARGWRLQPLYGLREGALVDVAELGDGRTALLASHALMFSGRASDGEAAQARVQLRRVLRGLGGGRSEPLPLQAAEKREFPGGGFMISFEFALLDLQPATAPRYRWRLRGLREDWGPWVNSIRVSYTELDPGAYRFELQARDAEGRVSEIEPWTFRITPPWYRTPLAVALAALVTLLLLAGAGRWLLLRRTARFAEEARRLAEQVTLRTAELAEANRSLERLAHSDGLTGLANRHRLGDYLQVVWRQCLDRSRPLSLLLIDVDHFKRYNDSHGHQAGDALLQALADQFARSLRRGEDLAARYGGEEFLLVLPGAAGDLAGGLAEELRLGVRDSNLGVTVSIGVAGCTPGMGQSLEQLIARADAALYAAKNGGRDRVVTADSLP